MWGSQKMQDNSSAAPVPAPPSRGCLRFQNSTSGTRSSISIQHSDKSDSSILFTPQSDLEPQLYDASSPPTNDGTSIDNLSAYIHWLQGRFPTYWTLLDEAEEKLRAMGFVFKSIVLKKNMSVVIECGVAVGIAAMFVDEAQGCKRYHVLKSSNLDEIEAGSDTSNDSDGL